MKKINLNKLARQVTLRESGQEISIAQVKEVMKLLFEELSEYYPSAVLEVIERYE